MYKLPIYILKERVANAYDADELVDLLEVSSEQLLEAFEDQLVLYRDKFLFLDDVDLEEED